MSVADELRDWANERAKYHYNRPAGSASGDIDEAIAGAFVSILAHGWPDRIQADLDKKDALIARLQDMLDGARERYKEDGDRLDKKDAEIAALKERLDQVM